MQKFISMHKKLFHSNLSILKFFFGIKFFHNLLLNKTLIVIETFFTQAFEKFSLYCSLNYHNRLSNSHEHIYNFKNIDSYSRKMTRF